MVAYADLMFTMVWLFALLSVFMVPAMYYYSQGTGIGTYVSWNQYSLGNFGYSTSKCQVSPYDLGSLPIKCQYGKLTKIISAGVMPEDLARKDVCNSQTVDEKSSLCTVRSDIGKLILDNVKEDAERKGLFLFKFTTSDIYNAVDTTSIPEKCKNENARIFVSYTCEQP